MPDKRVVEVSEYRRDSGIANVVKMVFRRW